ncbi:hypothetical protein K8R43_06330 [archaeon]|nr:hypothetical protein [archaeon]
MANHCSKCGKILKKGDIFCSMCGNKIKSKDDSTDKPILFDNTEYQNRMDEVARKKKELDERYLTRREKPTSKEWEENYKEVDEVFKDFLKEVDRVDISEFVETYAKWSKEEFTEENKKQEIEEGREALKKARERIVQQRKRINREYKEEAQERIKNEKSVLVEHKTGTHKPSVLRTVSGVSIVCPYCENQYVEEHDRDQPTGEFIAKCPKCSKEYEVLAGRITKWSGCGTGIVQYGLPSYTVRLRIKSEERVLFFESYGNFRYVKRGDYVLFLFKKKFLRSGFSEKPALVMDKTANTYTIA